MLNQLILKMFWKFPQSRNPTLAMTFFVIFVRKKTLYKKKLKTEVTLRSFIMERMT